jgi:carboxyl-terminal processing protease
VKIRSLALLFCFACSSPPPSTAPASAPVEDEPLKAQVLLRILYQAFSEGHYKPPPTDNKLSEQLFDAYMQRLDRYKRVFTQEDVNKLIASRDALDEQMREGRYAFFRQAYELQTAREATICAWCETLSKDPFDFTIKEELIANPKDYPKDENELKERWRKTLKSWAIGRLVEQLETQEKNPAAPQKEMKVLEEEARAGAKKQCTDIFTQLSSYTVEERRASYLDTIASLYDPHSEFLAPTEKANFDVKASGSLQGTGINLKEADGNLVISQIIPGSPADLKGGIAVGDILVSVARGDEAAVSVVGGDAKEVSLLLRGDKGTKITITIKKSDNALQEFTLICNLILIEEAYAKSALITRGKQKVALLQLPSFYADTSGAGGHKSTEDVAKILKNLKKEGVSQLIFDLRGNVGGSLAEAVSIAGLFISKGPIVQLKGGGDLGKLYEDTDPEIQFKGDLLLLLDQTSVSSAEVFAAAMQDYQRGVLVGSETTYGKGTAQRVISLDELLPADAKDLAPLGAIKITLEKFYRVNGGATQLKGVASDIVLPDQYKYQKSGEQRFDNPMPWDETKPSTYEKWKPTYDLKVLQEKSAARIKERTIFQLLDENAKRLKKNSEREAIPLQLEAYRSEKKQVDEEAKKYAGILTPSEGVTVSTLSADKASFAKLAPGNKSRLEKWQQQSVKDPYLEEALNILADMQ